VKYLIVNGDDFGASRGISRGIVEAHRGTISVRNNTGPGCTFTVTLPLAS